MIEKAIGKRVQEFRKKKKLTQEQMAELVGLSHHHYSTLERGLYSIKLDTLVQIINILGCSADDIFCDVIDNGYKTRASRLSDMLAHLSPEEQAKIFDVVETMIKNAK
ncbi:MAG: helix-turn-helix transcriptional regulator [Ruminococcaceae bacterium]|nr:helix-turn-helix transcriptional regulator [Oscillospiraceae bacterium]